ncbi:MAG: DNA cytosine methyltransferase [Bacteroidales bacterium]|nr:DNA cytosine methyltransferase [Bacteroidales bacterium]
MHIAHFAFMDSLFSYKDFVDSSYDANDQRPTCVEICAGAGGQALGLEQAGFRHIALVEIEKEYCTTLLGNRPSWNVISEDVHSFSGAPYAGADLFAGGVPCPPFSVAGKQLGENDERDLFPQAIRLIREINPKAILLENVRGIFDKVFDDYRKRIKSEIEDLGYRVYWKLLNASDYGVPQLRPRAVLVAIRNDISGDFSFPSPCDKKVSVGEAICDLLGENGWKQCEEWKESANIVAPTIVGGSKKHGGPDLGPTRARNAWAAIGIDGKGIADDAPLSNFEGNPRLTTRMVARIQGFPDDWRFKGGKTLVYRQIGNAFPPPVAKAVGEKIKECLS